MRAHFRAAKGQCGFEVAPSCGLTRLFQWPSHLFLADACLVFLLLAALWMQPVKTVARALAAPRAPSFSFYGLRSHSSRSRNGFHLGQNKDLFANLVEGRQHAFTRIDEFVALPSPAQAPLMSGRMEKASRQLQCVRRPESFQSKPSFLFRAFCCPRIGLMRSQYSASLYTRGGCKRGSNFSVESSQCDVKTRRAPVHKSRDQKPTALGAAACPLLNVVDFSRLRTPPLTAEELLSSQEQTNSISLQIHASSVAASLAAGCKDEQRTGKSRADCRLDNVGMKATFQADKEGTQISMSSVANLRNYRALLFYTSWDSRSQALVKTLADLARISSPLQDCERGNRKLTGERATGALIKDQIDGRPDTGAKDTDGAKADEDLRTRSEMAGSIPGRKEMGAGEVGGEAQGLEDILSSCVPSWLPITGVRVYNSLVVASGRRALQKQTRMLTNLRQLRHHERALNLMVREGVSYGAGLLPALQIWRKDSGSHCGTEDSLLSARPAFVFNLESLNVSDKSALDGKYESRAGAMRNSNLKTDITTRWQKVLDVRGVGPVRLAELAGYDATAWREEEALLLQRALLKRRTGPGEANKETGCKESGDILSRGIGGFASGLPYQAAVREDLRTWLFQISTLYQYHALQILLKRLRYAEDEFPEFEEFNIRKFNPRIAKLKGLLKD
ncbi:hypothetical protein CSUI_005380 [Cystoisospora suis]|uniref:Transmembrane protein n=1 Tax=Cystoisospora suis TaxID=483139 RepID=A0A2C6KY78_9APIC|nr:hypothetical protein CSUI_005380 [Cystoisospora suis]